MKIVELNPDVALAALLDGKVEVQTSANKSHTIRAYGDEERPNKGVGDEFIDVGWNGAARSLTELPDLFRGNLLLTIWVKAQTDGRAKKKIVRQIVAQVAELSDRKISQGFFFRFDPSAVITPTTTNLTTGYSTTILNVEWHTTYSGISPHLLSVLTEDNGELLLEDNMK